MLVMSALGLSVLRRSKKKKKIAFHCLPSSVIPSLMGALG